MRDKPRLGQLSLLVASLVGLGLVIALVWAMVLGETRSRQLSLQFEVFRASSALIETWLDEPEASLVGGAIVGFGVYDDGGKALVNQGSAPAGLVGEAPRAAQIAEGPGGATLRLTRPLSAGMGQGGLPGAGRMMAPMRNPGGRQGRRPASATAPGGPRTLWLEYSLDGRGAGRLLLVGGGAALSLILLGLYVLLFHLLRKNGELREGEARNRELAELGEAARTLVHEIKNPLGIIGIQAATLRRREGEASDTGRAAQVIDGEVRRLARMADRIREFLKSGAGEAGEVELSAFLGTFASRYGGEAPGAPVGPRLSLSLPEGGGEAKVRIDADRLSLALDNLVSNAWEADPGGKVELILAPKGRHWTISVADRGPGVPAADRGRLFEPFFTTKEKGSGIGLALARSIARGAGGNLVFEERHGGGALFTLGLPASR